MTSRVWLITGTSSGFGRRLVSIVRQRGDRVIATARKLADITDFVEDPKLPRSSVHCAELDIASGTEQVKNRIDAIIRTSGWGTVDVLVNNAGTGIPAFLEEGGAELLRHQYQTNVFGTLDVTTAVLPYMRKLGTVVMIGSRSGWKTDIKGYGLYGSSKAAVHAIGETMAVELEPFGIRVLLVEPGSFRTEGIYRNTFNASRPIPDYDEDREKEAERFRKPAGETGRRPCPRQ
ncbi:hypothetical protein JVU11DRAFT_8511 [Chiua virens]|nr:hypothetical protein JVU11DRAFT_8511 [Chiua virens]